MTRLLPLLLCVAVLGALLLVARTLGPVLREDNTAPMSAHTTTPIAFSEAHAVHQSSTNALSQSGGYRSKVVLQDPVSAAQRSRCDALATHLRKLAPQRADGQGEALDYHSLAAATSCEQGIAPKIENCILEARALEDILPCLPSIEVTMPTAAQQAKFESLLREQGLDYDSYLEGESGSARSQRSSGAAGGQSHSLDRRSELDTGDRH